MTSFGRNGPPGVISSRGWTKFEPGTDGLSLGLNGDECGPSTKSVNSSQENKLGNMTNNTGTSRKFPRESYIIMKSIVLHQDM